eukprot:2526412-Rhodomonas_salina.1
MGAASYKHTPLEYQPTLEAMGAHRTRVPGTAQQLDRRAVPDAVTWPSAKRHIRPLRNRFQRRPSLLPRPSLLLRSVARLVKPA